MTQQAKISTSKIAGVATVEPDRIELMVREAVERKFPRFEVHRVDVRLDQERESLQTLARGRACVHICSNKDCTEFEGTFQLTGYRSSHTPLGLDNLELSFDLREVASVNPEKITYEDEDHFLFWREDITNQSFRTGSVSIHFNQVGITDSFIFFLDAQGNRVATTEPDQLDPQLLKALEDIESIQREAV